jgi:hypothetical protein
MKIYLAGNVPKGDKELESYVNWRKHYAAIISRHLKAEFIDPYERCEGVREDDPISVFGADCRHIKESDLIIINAENQLGVGTSQELVIAKYFQKPVITILPKGSFHRKINALFDGEIIEDWIHPFIYAFSDVILERIEDFQFTPESLNKIQPKTISIIDSAIIEMQEIKRQQ